MAIPLWLPGAGAALRSRGYCITCASPEVYQRPLVTRRHLWWESSNPVIEIASLARMRWPTGPVVQRGLVRNGALFLIPNHRGASGCHTSDRLSRGANGAAAWLV